MEAWNDFWGRFPDWFFIVEYTLLMIAAGCLALVAFIMAFTVWPKRKVGFALRLLFGISGVFLTMGMCGFGLHLAYTIVKAYL